MRVARGRWLQAGVVDAHLGGCSSVTSGEGLAQAGGLRCQGWGSPAAHYCVQIGGTSTTIVHWGARGAAAGEMGLCLFADGSAIDDWALFYKQGGDLRGRALPPCGLKSLRAEL
ncbi:DUF333 domain-containing protein [Ideonella paludis]|uniref:DUF333 domain-containing protein n=1 Tax=Ideonella paludis TaxID=1233411 RepID=UPI00363E0C96